MALIKCPECGREISDKAQSCPHCGNPIMPAPPTAPVYSSSAPQVGIDTQKLKCPYCGEVLGPKDVLSSGWAKCPTCGETIKLTGANGEYDDNVLIERILPFALSKEDCHELFMSKIMVGAGTNMFESMRMVSLKRLYFWVREFGRGDDRVIYPMCQFGKNTMNNMTNGTQWLNRESYERLFPTDRMVPFNSDDLRDTEMLAKEMSASEVKLEFSHTKVGHLDPTPNYFCLPMVEEVVEYEGKKYTFLCSAGCGHIWSDTDLPMEPMPEPNYTQMKPVLYTLWGIVAVLVLIGIIAGFAESVGGTIFALIAVGIIGYVFRGLWAILFVAISAIPKGIDTLICKAINTKRRKKFRAEYASLQEAKTNSAKKRMNVVLTYEVPEFPIP